MAEFHSTLQHCDTKAVQINILQETFQCFILIQMANILVHPSVFTVSISQKRVVSNWVSENQSQIITLTNHSGHIQAHFSEPINYSVHVADGKHGKHVQISHYWFWFHSFYFFTLYSFYSLLFYSLVFLFDEKVASVF